VSEPKLKPCPFCGHAPRMTVRQDVSLWSSNVVDWFTICCYNCDVQVNECDDRAEAVKRWNTRRRKPA
jgi:Lar family restriction alleviation protein